jgi:putative transposase
VEFVVSDDHAGLRRAIQEVLPEAVWQRCYVHFLRNVLDYLPRKADDDCLQEAQLVNALPDAERRGGSGVNGPFLRT